MEYKKEFDLFYLEKYYIAVGDFDEYAKAHSDDVFNKDRNIRKTAVDKFYRSNIREILLSYELDFFDSLWACVKNYACDQNYAFDSFGLQIVYLWYQCELHISSMRKEQLDESVGAGLEALSHRRSNRVGFIYELLPQLEKVF